MIEPFGFVSTMSLAALTRSTLASVCAPSSASLKLALHKNLQRFDNNWNIYKNSRGSRYIQLPSSFRFMCTVNLLFDLIWSIFIGLLKKTIYFSKPLSDRIRIHQKIKKLQKYYRASNLYSFNYNSLLAFKKVYYITDNVSKETKNVKHIPTLRTKTRGKPL